MHQALLDLWVITYENPVTMGTFYAIAILFAVVIFNIIRRT